MKKIIITLIFVFILGFIYSSYNNIRVADDLKTDYGFNLDQGIIQNEPHELSIESLKERDYPGSNLIIEQELSPGSNYSRYVASYVSDGYKQYGLLTIPNQDVPSGGFPAIIFNHGYIQPSEYQTTQRYVAYTDAFSRNGYVVYKPDYRGHGDSEGLASGGYGSNAYTIDVLNALSSVKKLDTVNPEKVGMWGHSMGGFITLRSMVVDPSIKAGVIWGGVVASYPDLLNNWRRRSTTPDLTRYRGSWRNALTDEFGRPEENPAFWNSISSNSYLSDISGPVQLHHGTADTSVPVLFSELLHEQLLSIGKITELYTYQGDDHNISSNFSNAMEKSVDFFNRYIKES